MASRFPPSGVNAGSEYLSSFGREFAFKEIPFRICRARDDCVEGGGRERHLKGVVAGASQIEAILPPHPGMGSGALQKGHNAIEPLSWIYSYFSMWKVGGCFMAYFLWFLFFKQTDTNLVLTSQIDTVTSWGICDPPLTPFMLPCLVLLQIHGLSSSLLNILIQSAQCI